MSSRLALIMLAASVSLLASGMSNDEELSRLIDHAKTASIDQQPRLYAEIAERELKSADNLYSADDVAKARLTVGDVVSSADKASDAAIRSGKHLKDTEIALRRMAVKLRDITRKLSIEDQGPVKSAADHLETLRTDLLSHMFKGKK